jgi:hypothetical protein
MNWVVQYYNEMASVGVMKRIAEWLYLYLGMCLFHYVGK